MAAPKGLALVLELGQGVSFAAGTAAIAAASVPVITYNLRRPHFTAAAAAVALSSSSFRYADNSSSGLAELKPILGIFHPANIAKVLCKNVGVQFLMKFNMYMADYLEHEKAAIAAEEQGQQPPEPPPLPDFTPVVHRGVYNFVREILVATVRRIYEHIAVARLPAHKAESVLRDSRAWIKNVLSVRHKNEKLTTKLFKYQFATLHSTALFYAADCTVAVGYHAYATFVTHRSKKPAQKALYLAKGASLHVARCTVTLLAVSVGAAVGSAIKPGIGTLIGQVSTDIVVSIACGMIISRALEH